MIGVYVITCLVNGKQYIGQSNDVGRRFKEHCGYGNKQSPVTPDIIRYGVESFTIEMIHTFDSVERERMVELEMCEIRKRNTTDPTIGYNRIEGHMNGDDNPNYGNKWTDEAKSKMSELQIARHLSGNVYGDEWKSKMCEAATRHWAENPDLKSRMAQAVKKTKQKKYKFIQMTRDGEYIRTWDTVEEILEANPSWKWQNIYAVCNGYKPTIYGFRWRKELKNGG